MLGGVFVKGIIIGFCFSVIVGPIGILCIRRSLAEGFLMGLAVGVGAAIADTIFSAIAAFGLTSISGFLLNHMLAFALLGGSYLIYLGITIFKKVPPLIEEKFEKTGFAKVAVTTFFLTMVNPMSILVFIAFMANFGFVTDSINYFLASLLVGGFFVGAAVWWLLLSGVATLFRSRLSTTMMRRVNQISGFVIASFGAAMGIKQLLKTFFN